MEEETIDEDPIPELGSNIEKSGPVKPVDTFVVGGGLDTLIPNNVE